MNKKEASIIKVLADIGAHDPELTPEQEEIFQQALCDDNEVIKQFIDKIEDSSE